MEKIPNEPQILYEYQKRLTEDFPDLKIDTLKIIGSGWHHDAIEVNSNIIFRIPRGVHDLEKLESGVGVETRLLRRLQDKLPVTIPNPLYVAPQDAYFGYPKLEGVLLQDLVTTFNQQDQTRLREDWVDIAISIHSALTVEEAHAMGVPDFEGPGPSSADRIFKLPNVDQAVIDFAKKVIHDMHSLDRSALQYVFIHNDLQFHNMLANSAAKRISGLIDWTDACVAPIAREFAINEWMQDDLLEQVAILYEAKTGVNIDTNQARMWRSVEEISDYVESSESGDLEDATKTMERIRQLMQIRP